MKRIYNFLLAAVALLAFVPAVKAQDYTEQNGIAYSKTISKPDQNGVYTITLESFVTGSVTKKQQSIPADIVLVLDVSGSMAFDMDGNRSSSRDFDSDNVRLDAMKTAVKAFIEQIDINDQYETYVAEGSSENVYRTDSDGNHIRLGNKIAIVTFASSASTKHNLTALTSKSTLISTVNGFSAGGGTQSDEGLDNAYTILSALSDDRQLRTVVLFTDGDPGNGSYWEGAYYDGWNVTTQGYSLSNLGNYGVVTWNTANAAISKANDIKKLANEDKGIISRVYTVSIQTDPSDYTKVYLGKTSSNYSEATNMGTITTSGGGMGPRRYSVSWNSTDIWSNGDGTKVAEKYAFATTDADQLKEVFETIAGESGGASIDLGEQTLTEVDVVSASFTLPEGANASSIGLYTAACSGHQIVSGKEVLTFDNPVAITDGSVTVDGDELKNNIIKVSGFDFSANYCAAIKDSDGSYIGEYRGYKLVITIPITMNSSAVGGPDCDTNGEGSGIYINGESTPLVTFVSPKVDLPVNLHIRKEGLEIGESAKFTIQRTTTPDDEDSWEDVTSVFVTRKSTDAKEGENAPITKVVGMPSTDGTNDFTYRIVEDGWSWSYTPGTKTPTRSDYLVSNPFIFTNTKKTDIDYKVRHAESKVTNTFNKTGGATYVDSKTNTRTK